MPEILDPYSFALAVLAILWSAYQQHHISKLCKDCPYMKQAQREEEEIERILDATK